MQALIPLHIILALSPVLLQAPLLASLLQAGSRHPELCVEGVGVVVVVVVEEGQRMEEEGVMMITVSIIHPHSMSHLHLVPLRIVDHTPLPVQQLHQRTRLDRKEMQ